MEKTAHSGVGMEEDDDSSMQASHKDVKIDLLSEESESAHFVKKCATQELNNIQNHVIQMKQKNLFKVVSDMRSGNSQRSLLSMSLHSNENSIDQRWTPGQKYEEARRSAGGSNQNLASSSQYTDDFPGNKNLRRYIDKTNEPSGSRSITQTKRNNNLMDVHEQRSLAESEKFEAFQGFLKGDSQQRDRFCQYSATSLNSFGMQEDHQFVSKRQSCQIIEEASLQQESSILNRSSCKSFPTSIKKEALNAKQMKSKFFQGSSSSQSAELSQKAYSIQRTPELNPNQKNVCEFIPIEKEEEKQQRSAEVQREVERPEPNTEPPGFQGPQLTMERRRIYSFQRSARGEISSNGTPGFPRQMLSKEQKMQDTQTTPQVTQNESPSISSGKVIALSQGKETFEESKEVSRVNSLDSSNPASRLDILHKQDSCPLSSIPVSTFDIPKPKLPLMKIQSGHQQEKDEDDLLIKSPGNNSKGTEETKKTAIFRSGSPRLNRSSVVQTQNSSAQPNPNLLAPPLPTAKIQLNCSPSSPQVFIKASPDSSIVLVCQNSRYSKTDKMGYALEPNETRERQGLSENSLDRTNQKHLLALNPRRQNFSKQQSERLQKKGMNNLSLNMTKTMKSLNPTDPNLDLFLQNSANQTTSRENDKKQKDNSKKSVSRISNSDYFGSPKAKFKKNFEHRKSVKLQLSQAQASVLSANASQSQQQQLQPPSRSSQHEQNQKWRRAMLMQKGKRQSKVSDQFNSMSKIFPTSNQSSMKQLLDKQTKMTQLKSYSMRLKKNKPAKQTSTNQQSPEDRLRQQFGSEADKIILEFNGQNSSSKASPQEIIHFQTQISNNSSNQFFSKNGGQLQKAVSSRQNKDKSDLLLVDSARQYSKISNRDMSKNSLMQEIEESSPSGSLQSGSDETSDNPNASRRFSRIASSNSNNQYQNILPTEKIQNPYFRKIINNQKSSPTQDMKYHQSFRYKKEGENEEGVGEVPSGLLSRNNSPDLDNSDKQVEIEIERHSGSECAHTPKYGVEDFKNEQCDAFAKRIQLEINKNAVPPRKSSGHSRHSSKFGPFNHFYPNGEEGKDDDSDQNTDDADGDISPQRMESVESAAQNQFSISPQRNPPTGTGAGAGGPGAENGDRGSSISKTSVKSRSSNVIVIHAADRLPGILRPRKSNKSSNSPNLQKQCSMKNNRRSSKFKNSSGNSTYDLNLQVDSSFHNTANENLIRSNQSPSHESHTNSSQNKFVSPHNWSIKKQHGGSSLRQGAPPPPTDSKNQTSNILKLHSIEAEADDGKSDEDSSDLNFQNGEFEQKTQLFNQPTPTAKEAAEFMWQEPQESDDGGDYEMVSDFIYLAKKNNIQQEKLLNINYGRLSPMRGKKSSNNIFKNLDDPAARSQAGFSHISKGSRVKISLVKEDDEDKQSIRRLPLKRGASKKESKFSKINQVQQNEDRSSEEDSRIIEQVDNCPHHSTLSESRSETNHIKQTISVQSPLAEDSLEARNDHASPFPQELNQETNEEEGILRHATTADIEKAREEVENLQAKMPSHLILQNRKNSCTLQMRNSSPAQELNLDVCPTGDNSTNTRGRRFKRPTLVKNSTLIFDKQQSLEKAEGKSQMDFISVAPSELRNDIGSPTFKRKARRSFVKQSKTKLDKTSSVMYEKSPKSRYCEVRNNDQSFSNMFKHQSIQVRKNSIDEISVSQTSFYMSNKSYVKGGMAHWKLMDATPMAQKTSQESSPMNNKKLSGDILQYSKSGHLDVSPLRVSQYKNMIQDIFLQIYKIKELMQEEYQEFPEERRIPFKFKKKGFNKLVIFDLDETLIHVKRDDTDEGINEGEDVDCHFEPEEEIEIRDPKTGEDIYAGFSFRPYTRECLEFVNQYYEVAIFTAGHQWFADKIIDYLDPTGTLIQHRLFRQHTCQLGDEEDCLFVKDLKIFSGEVTLDDILIIDNNIYSFAFNLENGVPILDYVGDKRDKELLNVIQYLDMLKGCTNIRERNEQHNQLLAIFNSNIEDFIQYYDSDDWSDEEDDHIDFDDDGITAKTRSRLKEMSSFDDNRFQSISIGGHEIDSPTLARQLPNDDELLDSRSEIERQNRIRSSLMKQRDDKSALEKLRETFPFKPSSVSIDSKTPQIPPGYSKNLQFSKILGLGPDQKTFEVQKIVKEPLPYGANSAIPIEPPSDNYRIPLLGFSHKNQRRIASSKMLINVEKDWQESSTPMASNMAEKIGLQIATANKLQQSRVLSGLCSTPQQVPKIGGTPEGQNKFFLKPFLQKGGAMQLTMQPESHSSDKPPCTVEEEKKDNLSNLQSSESDEFGNDGPRQKRFSQKIAQDKRYLLQPQTLTTDNEFTPKSLQNSKHIRHEESAFAKSDRTHPLQDMTQALSRSSLTNSEFNQIIPIRHIKPPRETMESGSSGGTQMQPIRPGGTQHNSPQGMGSMFNSHLMRETPLQVITEDDRAASPLEERKKDLGSLSSPDERPVKEINIQKDSEDSESLSHEKEDKPHQEINTDEQLGDNSFYQVAYLESSPKFNEMGLYLQRLEQCATTSEGAKERSLRPQTDSQSKSAEIENLVMKQIGQRCAESNRVINSKEEQSQRIFQTFQLSQPVDSMLQNDIDSDQAIKILNNQIPIGTLSQVEPSTNKHIDDTNQFSPNNFDSLVQQYERFDEQMLGDPPKSKRSKSIKRHETQNEVYSSFQDTEESLQKNKRKLRKNMTLEESQETVRSLIQVEQVLEIQDVDHLIQQAEQKQKIRTQLETSQFQAQRNSLAEVSDDPVDGERSRQMAEQLSQIKIKHQGQSLSPAKYEQKEGLDKDILQLQRSASTHVPSNLMIRPPNWQKRRNVIYKRLKTGMGIKITAEASEEAKSPEQRSPSPTSPGKSSRKFSPRKSRGAQGNLVMAKNIESVLERFNKEMEKQWESGAMRKGLIKSNPHLKKKRYIFSKEEGKNTRGARGSSALNKKSVAEPSPDRITILETPERFPTHSNQDNLKSSQMSDVGKGGHAATADQAGRKSDAIVVIQNLSPDDSENLFMSLLEDHLRRQHNLSELQVMPPLNLIAPCGADCPLKNVKGTSNLVSERTSPALDRVDRLERPSKVNEFTVPKEFDNSTQILRPNVFSYKQSEVDSSVKGNDDTKRAQSFIMSASIPLLEQRPSLDPPPSMHQVGMRSHMESRERSVGSIQFQMANRSFGLNNSQTDKKKKKTPVSRSSNTFTALKSLANQPVRFTDSMPELINRYQNSSRGISPTVSHHTISSVLEPQKSNHHSIGQNKELTGSFVGGNWPKTLTKNSSIVSQTYEPTFSFEKEETPLRIQNFQPGSHSIIGGSGSIGGDFQTGDGQSHHSKYNREPWAEDPILDNPDLMRKAKEYYYRGLSTAKKPKSSYK